MTAGTNLFASLSIVIVIEETLPAPALLDGLLATCDELAAQLDLVLVANGVGDETTVQLKQLTQRLADTTCLFLAARVDTDLACLAGLDNAIGDWVLLPSLTEAGIAAVSELAAAALRGYDIILGRPAMPPPPDRSVYGWTSGLFMALYMRLTGLSLLPGRSPMRLLSRAATLHLISAGHAEMLLRATAIGPGFAGTVVLLAGAWPALPQRDFYASWSKAMRVLMMSTSAPLRAATIVALGGGVGSLLYSVYVVATYLFAPVIERGWTTLSLQISGMMFLFSVVLLLISEYTIQILNAMGGRRRVVPVVRELRSPVTRSGGQLNVVDEEGRYRLGAPAEAAVATQAARWPA